MTTRKPHSVPVMTLGSLIVLSCALLFPARSAAQSGGGCESNGDYNIGSGYYASVQYCLETNLSGHVEADIVSGPNHPFDYDIVGVSAIVTDTTTDTIVYSGSTFDVTPNGDGATATLDFPAYTGKAGHVYSLTARACAKLSTTDSGECSSWTALTPAVPDVTY